LEQAQQEARDAKATVGRLNLNLTAAQNEIATIKAELKAVRQNRDDLQKLVDQLARERDQASTFARDAQEAITRLSAKESRQNSTTVALQKQIDDMKILIEEQRKLIEQLHKDAPAEPVDATRQPAPPTEPNESR
jgi:chromosome segregation ATPase